MVRKPVDELIDVVVQEGSRNDQQRRLTSSQTAFELVHCWHAWLEVGLGITSHARRTQGVEEVTLGPGPVSLRVRNEVAVLEGLRHASVARSAHACSTAKACLISSVLLEELPIPGNP